MLPANSLQAHHGYANIFWKKKALHSRMEDSEPEENPILNETESKLAISVLTECIIKLEILGNTLPTPVVPAEDRSYQSLEERFGKETPKKSAARIKVKNPNMVKLQRERALLEHILKGSLMELKETRTFNFLNDKVIQYTQEHKEERKLLTELAEYGLTAPGLKRELASSKLRTQEELSQNLQKLAVLQDKVAKVKNDTKVQLAFLANWEEARSDQVCLALQREEKLLEEQLDVINEETSNELRVHTELQMALEKTIQKIENLKADWDAKYLKDVEDKNEQLRREKEKREQNLSELRHLAEVYAAHKKELKEWQQFCHERQVALERLRHENAMATVVQAWWRGTMVRRGIGAFKKKKGPPKGAKKK